MENKNDEQMPFEDESAERLDAQATILEAISVLNEGADSDSEAKEKKKSRFARYLESRAQKKLAKEIADGLAREEKKQDAKEKKQDAKEKEADKQKRKMAVLLSDIENQIMGLDEQNKVLMYHVGTMRENNEALLEQVDVLKKNNDLLIRQFQATLKKNKISRILNIIYTALAIVFVVARIVSMMLNG